MSHRTIFALLLALMPTVEAAPQEFKVGIVDYSRAIQSVEDGKAAQARLDTMYAGEKARIEQLEAELKNMNSEYIQKEAMLSEQAKKEMQEKMYTKNMEYQQAYLEADQKMQQAYVSAMEQLMNGLKGVAEGIGTERNYDLILESSQGTVLYAKTGMDLTDEVIKRYNASH